MSNDPEKKPVGRLAFLIGLPKSGKSPLAREGAVNSIRLLAWEQSIAD